MMLEEADLCMVRLTEKVMVDMAKSTMVFGVKMTITSMVQMVETTIVNMVKTTGTTGAASLRGGCLLLREAWRSWWRTPDTVETLADAVRGLVHREHAAPDAGRHLRRGRRRHQGR